MDEKRKTNLPGWTYGVERLVVDARAAETPLARRIVERWKGPEPQVTEDVQGLVEAARREKDPLASGKRTLLVTLRKGPFLTPCQGMTERHTACCGYHILNVAENCPMDCTYCILQEYLDNPFVVVYANLEGIAGEIAAAVRDRRNGRLLRLGTGELADSLALDRLTGLSLDVIRAVEPFEDVVLELKTKTVEIENLLAIAPPPNVMVSWSLNTARNIAGEEIGAPSLEDRLGAARRCLDHGYRLGFHFDPLIFAESWEEEYRAVVEALFDTIEPSRIAYISLGGLRYPPAMKRTIEDRFAETALTCGELVRSWDGKMRYFRPIRVAMYRRMLQWIRARAPDVTVYLCMESPQVWHDVFGWAPSRVEDVSERLNAGCRKAGLAGHTMRVAGRGA